MCFIKSFFPVFDSKEGEFYGPKQIKVYQISNTKNHQFSFFDSFNWLSMLVLVQNRKYVDYGVRGSLSP
jgi:hypothetical protein